MIRCLSVSALVFAAFVGQAKAIEMFTNFHNGENIGFPPMQVPTSVYGGFGRGGWNPHAQGMPLKTNPPVPAMMPTGQATGGHFFDYYAGAPARNFGNNGNGSAQQLVSDRRRGKWQRGNSSSANNGGNGDSAGADTLSPNNSSRRSVGSGNAETAKSNSTLPAAPTILHAESADSEVFSHIPMIENQQIPQAADNDKASNALMPTSTPASLKQSEQEIQDWPRADALFPHGDKPSGDAG
jgi:hypothetical protein